MTLIEEKVLDGDVNVLRFTAIHLFLIKNREYFHNVQSLHYTGSLQRHLLVTFNKTRNNPKEVFLFTN